MKVFIIGVTGLLGSAGAKTLINNGHTVAGLSLPNYPQELFKNTNVTIHIGDYLTISDEVLVKLLKGFDALVFAAGIDERIKTPPPAFSIFNKYNVVPLERILKIAKAVGITRTVILGSYFTYFNRSRPQLKLALHHPYIKSRLMQQEVAFSFSDASFHVAVLELPYIFGVQEGRKPVWTFLVAMLLKMKGATYYPKGGSAMITVRQVGEAIRGALVLNIGANAYPLNYYNVTWKDMLKSMHKALGKPNRKIVTVPRFIYKHIMRAIYQKDRKAGYEGGLNLAHFSKMHTSNQFMPTKPAQYLGVTADDIEEAIIASTRASYAIIKSEATNYVEMTINEK